MSVSVCIATYNGEKFIELQLKSILSQLNNDDEIVIVDDCSIDNTLNIIKSINDSRFKIFSNEKNRGHVYSFGRSIELATKEIIIMSDQDDIWIESRVAMMKDKLLKSKVMLLTSNSNFIDSNGIEVIYKNDGVEERNSQKYLTNIIDIFKGKENYYGCAMAFKREFRKLIIPIPTYVESHDLWIALAANICKSNLHSNEVTLKRRIHGSNASIVQRKLALKILSRIIFLASIIQLYIRKLIRKKITL